MLLLIFILILLTIRALKDKLIFENCSRWTLSKTK